MSGIDSGPPGPRAPRVRRDTRGARTRTAWLAEGLRGIATVTLVALGFSLVCLLLAIVVAWAM